MAFTSLTMCQIFLAFPIRSDRDTLLTIGVFSNGHLAGAVMLTFLLQLAVIYTPALNPIFKKQPLTAQELAVSILLPALILVVVEAEKIAIRRGWLYRERREAQRLANGEPGTQATETRCQDGRSGPSS